MLQKFYNKFYGDYKCSGSGVDQDSGEPIDLCKLILAAKQELLK